MTHSVSYDTEPPHIMTPPTCPTAGRNQFTAVTTMIYVTMLFVIATIPTLISPALVGGWREQYGLSESQLGMLASADLAGLAIGAGAALLWQRRWPWRMVTIVALIVTCALNLLCMDLNNFPAFFIVRLLAGTGAGTLIGIYSAFIANAPGPERFIAATTFVQIATQGAAVALASRLQLHFGLASVFFCTAAVLLPLVPFVRLLPFGWPQGVSTETTDRAPAARHPTILLSLMVLAAFIPLDIFMAIYPFLPEFGHAFAGLSMASSTTLLGMSLFPSAIGPTIAFLLGERVGIGWPILASGLICAAMLLLLCTGAHSPTLYFFGVSTLQASWCFLNCYFYGAVIMINNELTAAATPVAAVSIAFGTTILGVAGERGGLVGLTVVALICVLVSILMVLCCIRRPRLAII